MLARRERRIEGAGADQRRRQRHHDVVGGDLVATAVGAGDGDADAASILDDGAHRGAEIDAAAALDAPRERRDQAIVAAAHAIRPGAAGRFAAEHLIDEHQGRQRVGLGEIEAAQRLDEGADRRRRGSTASAGGHQIVDRLPRDGGRRGGVPRAAGVAIRVDDRPQAARERPPRRGR